MKVESRGFGWQSCDSSCNRNKVLPGSMHQKLAEAVRFELTNGCPLPVFKTGAIDHSATLPWGRILAGAVAAMTQSHTQVDSLRPSFCSTDATLALMRPPGPLRASILICTLMRLQSTCIAW